LSVVCTYVHTCVHTVRTYVPTSVCPQNVSSISMKFSMYVEVNEWWPDPRSRSRTLESWKSLHFQKLSSPPFTKGADNRPLTYCSRKWTTQRCWPRWWRRMGSHLDTWQLSLLAKEFK